MNLQYISDSNGKIIGVFIPVKDWERLKATYKSLEDVEVGKQSREEILSGLKQAVEEMNLIKQGKLKARDAEDLLDEL